MGELVAGLGVGAFPGVKNESKATLNIVRIPQKHFHGMSKDKVKKCVEALCEGSTLKLRLDGEKEILERRYRDFVHLHNSQIGKDQPMSIEALVKECTKREAMRYLNVVLVLVT